MFLRSSHIYEGGEVSQAHQNKSSIPTKSVWGNTKAYPKLGNPKKHVHQEKLSQGSTGDTSPGFKLASLCGVSWSHHCWHYQEHLPRTSLGGAFSSSRTICILQCCGTHPVRLHPLFLALGLLPAWICSSVSFQPATVLSVLCYFNDLVLCLPQEKPAPLTVPEQFGRCEQTANSGILLQYLNSEIQLFSHCKHTAVLLASASELLPMLTEVTTKLGQGGMTNMQWYSSHRETYAHIFLLYYPLTQFHPGCPCDFYGVLFHRVLQFTNHYSNPLPPTISLSFCLSPPNRAVGCS